jgi:hypothetical protein
MCLRYYKTKLTCSLFISSCMSSYDVTTSSTYLSMLIFEDVPYLFYFEYPVCYPVFICLLICLHYHLFFNINIYVVAMNLFLSLIVFKNLYSMQSKFSMKEYCTKLLRDLLDSIEKIFLYTINFLINIY